LSAVNPGSAASPDMRAGGVTSVKDGRDIKDCKDISRRPLSSQPRFPCSYTHSYTPISSSA